MRAGVACLLAAVALTPPALAQQWDPGDRTLVTRFDRIDALATDARHVYAATPEGLLVFDAVARAWLRPSTGIDGYPAGERATALAWDDFSGDVWMGTRSGVVWRWSPTFLRWEQGVLAPGPVRHIAFARGDAWIEAGGRWLVARAGMLALEPAAAGTVPPEARGPASDRASGDAPFLRTTLAALPADPGGNRWRATALAAGTRRGTYWIGTDGGGLVAYDARTNTLEWLQPGLVSRGATLVVCAAGRLWFAGDGATDTGGLVLADTALTRWQRLDARTHGGPDGAVHAALATADRVWFAGAAGVHALPVAALAGGPRTADWLSVTSLDGLPADPALALAHAIDGVWVGTTRGLVHVDTTGAVSRPLLAGTPVYDLAVDGAVLWAASARGLVAIADDAAARAARLPPGLRGEVRAVASDGNTLRALTADALYTRTPDGDWHVEREPALAGIGTLRRLAPAHDGVWIAAEGGVAFRATRDGTWRYYAVPADIPEGPIVSVQPLGSDVWLGTPRGALRLPAFR